MRVRDKYDIRAEILVDTVHRGFSKLGYKNTIITKIERLVDNTERPYTGVNDVFVFHIQGNTLPRIEIDIKTINKYYRLGSERVIELLFYKRVVYPVIPKIPKVNPYGWPFSEQDIYIYQPEKRMAKYRKIYYSDLKNIRKIKKLNNFLKTLPLNMTIGFYEFNVMTGSNPMNNTIGIFIKRHHIDDASIYIKLETINKKEDLIILYYNMFNISDICSYEEFRNNIAYYVEATEIVDY